MAKKIELEEKEQEMIADAILCTIRELRNLSDSAAAHGILGLSQDINLQISDFNKLLKKINQ